MTDMILTIVTGNYRIKRKADVEDFRKKVSINPNRGLVLIGSNGKPIEFRMDKDRNMSVSLYVSETPIGWVSMEVASDTNPSYPDTVDDWLWKERKCLNHYFWKGEAL